MSGAAVRPVAQRKVAEISLDMQRGEMPDAPILGIGGITTALDVARFIKLGASAVQIGSALIWEDAAVFDRIHDELVEFMETQGYADLDAMKGIALDSLEGLS